MNGKTMTTALVLLAAGALQAGEMLGDWPEGKDPASIVRKVSDLFLTTAPDCYKPIGYSSPSGYCAAGYGRSHIHYSVVSLWINLMEAAQRLGDRKRVSELAALFEPFYGAKSNLLLTVKRKNRIRSPCRNATPSSIPCSKHFPSACSATLRKTSIM